MTSFRSFALMGALLLAFGTAGAAEQPLANRHMAHGVDCVSCHGTKTPQPGAVVDNKNCLTCHQSYEALAKRTEKLEPNPHFSHLGNVRCSDCHSGHQQPKLLCNDCHKFNMQPK